MAESKRTKVLGRISDAIANIENKNFTMYFFVADSKNTPNSSMEYVYQMALAMQNLGYKVCMLYQIDNEYTDEELSVINENNGIVDEMRIFTGVGEWLGEEYANLRHLNISLGTWSVSPSDFLFIPEAFSSLMFQTHQHKIPCKRFVLLQNFDYVTDMIPYGVEWMNYGIHEVIASTQHEAALIKRSFPYVKTRILSPCIPEYFRIPVKPKNLVVNMVAKKQSDVNRILKQFYWQYPKLKFVSFRDLRNFPRMKFAELLQDGAITVWVDDYTTFGNSALEAMRCGDIVIGKIPENIPEWMGDDNGLFDNGVWFTNVDDVPSILANVITSWMSDNIPEELTDAMEKTNSLYRFDKWNDDVRNLAEQITKERVGELKEFMASQKNNKEEKEEE